MGYARNLSISPPAGVIAGASVAGCNAEATRARAMSATNPHKASLLIAIAVDTKCESHKPDRLKGAVNKARKPRAGYEATVPHETQWAGG